MSLIADLVRAGVDPDLIARVAAELAEARAAGMREAAPIRTARQDRNARYYQKRKEASENVLIKTIKTEQDVSDAIKTPSVPPEVSPQEIYNQPPILPPSTSSLRSDDACAPRKRAEPKFTTAQIDGWFEKFYSAYPKRVNRKTARVRFESALKSGVDPGHVIASAKRFAEAHRLAGTESRFIKAPDAWLNAGKYDDEDLPQRERSKSGFAQMAIDMIEKGKFNELGIEKKRAAGVILELPVHIEDGHGNRDGERGDIPRNAATDLIRNAVRRM